MAVRTPDVEVGLGTAASAPPRWTTPRRPARSGALALGAVALLVVLSLAAPLIVRFGNHHPPNALYTSEALDPTYGVPVGPSGTFWFGADASGRDVFTRVLYGARVSLLVAFGATALGLGGGLVLGSIAGSARGWAESVLTGFVDVLLGFPLFLLAFGLGASCALGDGCLGGLVRPGVPLLICVIGLATTPYVARIVRGEVLSLRERPFVEAARALGAPARRILVREVAPNLAAPLIALGVLLVPANVLFEAALSFLGVGVRPPTPSWGGMIADATSSFDTAWWAFVFPGIFVVGTVLSLNLAGETLREAVDPRTD